MTGGVKWTAIVLTCPKKEWVQSLQKGGCAISIDSFT